MPESHYLQGAGRGAECAHGGPQLHQAGAPGHPAVLPERGRLAAGHEGAAQNQQLQGASLLHTKFGRLSPPAACRLQLLGVSFLGIPSFFCQFWVECEGC